MAARGTLSARLAGGEKGAATVCHAVARRAVGQGEPVRGGGQTVEHQKLFMIR